MASDRGLALAFRTTPPLTPSAGSGQAYPFHERARGRARSPRRGLPGNAANSHEAARARPFPVVSESRYAESNGPKGRTVLHGISLH